MMIELNQNNEIYCVSLRCSIEKMVLGYEARAR